MTEENQIEEMANIIALKAFEQAHLIDGDENLADIVATDLYEKGYRKASEVAREIFEELEENLNNLIRYYKEKRKYVTEIEYSEFEQRYCDIKIGTYEERLLRIAELKKKYTQEK